MVQRGFEKEDGLKTTRYGRPVRIKSNENVNGGKDPCQNRSSFIYQNSNFNQITEKGFEQKKKLDQACVVAADF
jgi:hypothetical protein